MKLERPMIDFVELDTSDVIVTSGCPDVLSQSKGGYNYCSQGAKHEYAVSDCEIAGQEFTEGSKPNP